MYLLLTDDRSPFPVERTHGCPTFANGTPRLHGECLSGGGRVLDLHVISRSVPTADEWTPVRFPTSGPARTPLYAGGGTRHTHQRRLRDWKSVFDFYSFSQSISRYSNICLFIPSKVCVPWSEWPNCEIKNLWFHRFNNIMTRSIAREIVSVWTFQ